MSLEQALADNTAALNANTAILEKLEAGREAAIAQLEAKGDKPATRSRKKADEPAAGPATPPEAPATANEPTVTEDDLRTTATAYIKGAGENVEDRKARAANIKSITDHFGTAALAGDNGIKDADQRAQALFYLQRFDAGLEVNFSAEYDFSGEPTQGGGESDEIDAIG